MTGSRDPLADLERHLLGGPRRLTRTEVAAAAGVPLDVAEELWGQLGFPHTADDDVAFTDADVEALRTTAELVAMGILEPESQLALVRTWGRSYARLAEWQTSLLAGIALADDEPLDRLDALLGEVLPRVGSLQDYIWRRHLEGAAQRLLPQVADTDEETLTAVVFVDIVGYTARSRSLEESALVDLVEVFEDETTRTVGALGGRVIKTIGDEVLFVVDDVHAATEAALELTARGEDDGEGYPRVRAGIAWGPVTSRLGDVFGPTVNLAARLTSLARPGTVLVDRAGVDVLTGSTQPPAGAGEEPAGLSPYAEHGALRFRRLRRVSVKGYRHLEPWVVRRRRAPEPGGDEEE